MSSIKQDLLYTKDHEWVKISGDEATVGITDYAQSSLGDVVFVDLPSAGTQAEQSATVATIESVKAVSDIYAPLSGEIVKINAQISSGPEIVNNSPYEGGWLFVVKMSRPDEKSQLLTPAQYEQLLSSL